MEQNYDFAGWATKANMRCSDGRTIMKDAFKECDGKKVPLVWNHNHDIPQTVLGHAILENRDDGVFAYGYFNDTESGKDAKLILQHGDIVSLSIYANQLREEARNVIHGVIREVSLVLAGANPKALIDSVVVHSDGSVDEDLEQGVIYAGESLILAHAEKEDAPQNSEALEHADETKDVDSSAKEQGKTEETADQSDEKVESVKDIFNTMNEKQKTAVYAVIGAALNSSEDDEKDDEKNKEEKTVKHNVFDQDQKEERNYLSHADGRAIIELAKSNGGNSLKAAIDVYMADNKKELAHADGDDDLGFRSIDTLFPEYQLVKPGAPETLTTDQGWIGKVLNKVGKTPKSRLRVRFADARDITGRRAQGYTKGTQKQFMGNLKLLGRTVDPTTVYNLDHLNRDDIIDIEDFDLVNYMYQDQRRNLNEELARQIMIGDGRNGDASDDGQKIDDTKIIPIWSDDDLFAIHTLVDIATMRTTLQGSDTSVHFGDNYVYAEAVIQSLLYGRENYKGSGSPDFFCAPHLVNQMLLARDFNGRRIYDNVNELKAAMNVNELITAEQFEGKTRSVVVNGVSQTRRLLGILVNLDDYKVGCAKGGEITQFKDFDIHFNQHESLLETRCSGMLVRPFSAIVLEEIVNP